MLGYAEKIFNLSTQVIARVSDHRVLPRISPALVVKAVLAVYWSRLGSLNALPLTRSAKFWKSWLPGPLCSADSLGRIVASMEADSLRQGVHHVYDRLKRNKALPDLDGLAVAVLDGHESSASYRRCCDGCLKRTTPSGQTQFYHRQVTLMLLCGSPPDRPAVRLLLDLEPQQPGEGELAAALRLLERVLVAYPRAFDVVLADAYYAVAPFLNFLLGHGKQALVVLKDERRDAYQDAAGLWAQQPALPGSYQSRRCRWWDFPDLHSWPEVKATIRVVRSEESWTVKPQLTQEATAQTTRWVWLTTLSVAQARTEQVVRLAHLRWDIENHGFNELVNGWHADHLYRHQPQAIECFLLLAFLAYNIFHAFFALNLKPELRRGRTMEFWVRLIAAEIHAIPRFHLPHAPP
ncbi:MAG TPA: transposase [Terriglobales bacterium]